MGSITLCIICMGICIIELIWLPPSAGAAAACPAPCVAWLPACIAPFMPPCAAAWPTAAAALAGAAGEAPIGARGGGTASAATSAANALA
ncbi:Mycobacterium rhizamassiliense ORFan [Mycobacterium rhizamassiliense]|uniref:Mycobacterium rhizamassiliense ORFan n=1 Tax=Mycobacterium rhizamassiliense TaxID=1841860 RepID=A0A2U3NQM9_9MYCO|nr:Mycobacterium rhizamassiliense ORFan [Mycobacterium rhizamassiliense]